MENEPTNQGRNPEDWLADEAAGDDQLYNLLLQKERVGERKANDEIDLSDATQEFEDLNQQIARRREELGLDPPSYNQD